MMKRLPFIILFSLLFPLLKGQDVKVVAAFDTSRIFIGDQVHFKVKVEKPGGMKLSIPVFKDTLLKNIQIIKGPSIDSTKNNGKTFITENYLVTSFDSGSYRVKPVYAEFKSAEGVKRFYSDYSTLIVMRVNVAPADTTQKFYDIIDPYRAPLTFGEVFPWIVAAIIAGVLVWVVIRYIKAHPKVEPVKAEIINPDPAHVIAFRELEKLKQEELWQKGEFKLYYTRLTEILRQYLENRYKVYSLELTTTETLDALLKTGFKRDATFEKLRGVLRFADLVKFAKHVPVADENESNYKDSWYFVDITRVREEEVTAEVSYKKEGEVTA